MAESEREVVGTAIKAARRAMSNAAWSSVADPELPMIRAETTRPPRSRLCLDAFTRR
jgi:hypothetical protein